MSKKDKNQSSKLAAIQMASGPNVNANLIEAGRLISQAAQAGAELVVLPENFAIMGLNEAEKVAVRESDQGGPIQEFLAEQAEKNGVWLVGGTIPMESAAANKVKAACMIYDDKGQKVARYDKTHLFDVHIVDSGEKYAESETIEAGDEVLVIDTPFGRMGVAICYDLRFPELFRSMLDQGAQIIALPAAFTATTGRAHWEVLVRARAIENLCYMVAANQGGYHVNGKESHGDSMIVDPWGNVLDRLVSGSGYVLAQVNIEMLENTREKFPVIKHRKFSCGIS